MGKTGLLIQPQLRRILALLLMVSLVPLPAACWGYDGHAQVNRVAAKRIPRDMPRFFRKAEKWLTYLGYEPDRWRDSREVSLRSAQAPDHFIDLELVADVPELPRERHKYYRLLYEKRAATPATGDTLLPEVVGLQPYITIEVYERLRAAFREYRELKDARKATDSVEKKIVFYAGWLGHYVADGAQPLHTTIHYNGWVGDNPYQYTTDKQTHYLFESEFVAANIRAEDFAGMVEGPRRLANPFDDYLKYLRESNQLVEPLYQLEKKEGFCGPGTAEGREFVRRRLAAGGQMLVNLWYTAWLESAEPPPPKPAPPGAPLPAPG